MMSTAVSISHYDLPSVLDASDAAQLRRDLSKFKNSPLSIKSDAVERVSTSCLQVLLTAAQTWKSLGHEFTLEQPSQVLVESLGRLVIAKEFKNKTRL